MELGFCYLKREYVIVVQVLSNARLFVTPWTVALQAALSMGFSRQAYCHSLLQGIFPTQGWNLRLLCLLHCKQIFYPLRLQGNPSCSSVIHFLSTESRPMRSWRKPQTTYIGFDRFLRTTGRKPIIHVEWMCLKTPDAPQVKYYPGNTKL